MRIVKPLTVTVMACAGLLLVLGLVIWTGNGDQLIPLHAAIGVVMLGALWWLCVIGLRAGVSRPTITAAAGWGVLVLALGMVQEVLVPGSWHWTVQVLHLAVAMATVWWARRVAQLIGAASHASPVSTQPITTPTATRNHRR